MTDLEFIEQSVARREAMILDANDKIWSYAELPYEEYKSSTLLCDILEKEGFAVEKGVAHIPTAFTARYSRGTGRPVMGILGPQLPWPRRTGGRAGRQGLSGRL